MTGSLAKASRQPNGPARPSVAEPLEERLLMAMARAAGGSGYSGTLSANTAIRQQQLICDPIEPAAGSTSVQYEADKVTLRGMIYGPGYGPFDNQTALVEVLVNDKTQLQPLPSFLDRPAGKETGYVQTFYRLFDKAGQITPPRENTIVDEEGVDGVDTHALQFQFLPAVQADTPTRYVIFADKGTHSGNPPDYLLTLDGKRLGPGELLPAVATSKPAFGSIAGTTFEDMNGDGAYDPGDKPVGGAIVYLDLDRDGALDDTEPRQVSFADDGTYLFTGVAPGTYQVREVTPSGFLPQLSVPVEGFNVVRVTEGRRSRGVDFGNLKPGQVSGVVFNDVNGNGVRERTELAGVAGAIVYVDLNRNGARDATEPFDVSTSPLGAWSVGGLAPGTYVVRQVPPAGYVQTLPSSFHVITLTGSGEAAVATFGDHAVGPRVTGVFISGSTWPVDFLNYVASSRQGDATAGFAIDARDQFRTLPWMTINRVSIRFDSPVNVEMNDLSFKGYTGADYPFARFSYDPGTMTAAWTITTNLVSDRLTLNLNADAGGVTGTSGLALDGEWTAGNDAFPSGDGYPGGDFVFGFNVLAGDATGDGVVGALDLSYARLRLNRSTAIPGTGNGAYTIFGDVTADGRINALDLSAMRQRLNRRLPRVIIPLPFELPALKAPSITRDVFSVQPVV